MLWKLTYFIWPGEELTNFTENICKGWVVTAGLLKQAHISTSYQQVATRLCHSQAKWHFISPSCLHNRN